MKGTIKYVPIFALSKRLVTTPRNQQPTPTTNSTSRQIEAQLNLTTPATNDSCAS
jgi:hypothetical protein